MHKNGLQIAIDGPASAGKSTVAKLIAKKFSYVYCDTGAMYRSVTLKAMRNNIPLTDEARIMKMMKHTDISFAPGKPQQKVFIDGHEVTNAIRSEAVTNSVSTVAALLDVRKDLSNRQREIAENGGIVMDGRDIGTTVLPHAEVKIFLVASVQERAKRRFKDNAQKGIHTPIKKLAHEIEVRDYKDSHRKISPLTQAKDAIRIDTTHVSIQGVVDKIAEIIDKKLK
ncbi:(d)CMP kinase [Acetilactobacillus jinshanensis]|uniref:Cytidylate kinase n=1 Tax=Acetilactobacillus jinshanensis TaxID=1720083 RepID=A0A4V1ALL4_9LACO|nr:(d)CMP kinase [Acetilactobacillus jinshanensis]QBP18009.1 (d)CMP kinase [Acetilactobacillus jinshanensis]URL60871.1 (d)CMP kinase [uncultured bacterium]